jgi:hypothetical protein
MATVKATITRHGEHTVVFTWALTQANADGHPIPPQYADYCDRAVHILGTFDSATVVWQGGNDGSDYLTLTDPQGNAISKTAAAIEQVLEGALFQKPSSSGGGASQAVTVIAVCRRGRGGKEI